MMQEVSVTVSCDPQMSEQMTEEEILASLVAETGPIFPEVPTKKAKLRESRLQIMEDKEDSLNKYQLENRRLQQASLRLEQENDNLAHKLITSKVALRNALDKAEDKVDTLTSDLQLTRCRLKAVEEEKQRMEDETAMLKEVLRGELDRAEQEAKRSSGIIADYKQICSQLTTRLEREQLTHSQEVNSLKSMLKSCHAGESEEDDEDYDKMSITTPSPVDAVLFFPGWKKNHGGLSEAEQRRDEQEKASFKAQIRQLEKELAQTKLQMVEANCRIQELEHERGILANDLQEAKNNWISKAFTSLRTSADGAPTSGWSLNASSLSGWKLSWPHNKDGQKDNS
ncbi:rab GTPase-activating protein 1-like [Nerophis ophidion]|uniref:rab GTPase-activating protein 1-like n=1 Tax=Nerophis ophidion TaxID=159077 RepID=UPI002AE0A09E|nr:rab GTPase-activating protein 1-like [Nerophis ophidion]